MVYYFKIKDNGKTINFPVLGRAKRVPNRKCREGILFPYPALLLE